VELWNARRHSLRSCPARSLIGSTAAERYPLGSGNDWGFASDCEWRDLSSLVRVSRIGRVYSRSKNSSYPGPLMTAARLLKWVPLVVGIAAACTQDPVSAFGPQDDTLRVRVNQELELTLQNVGPGEYLSPPTIVSESDRTVLQFLDAVMLPSPPAGAKQLFRFEGRQPGVATVSIQQSIGVRPITAIVKVR